MTRQNESKSVATGGDGGRWTWSGQTSVFISDPQQEWSGGWGCRSECINQSRSKRKNQLLVLELNLLTGSANQRSFRVNAATAEQQHLS